MRFAARGNVHLAVPGEQDRDCQVGGGAEAEQAHMLAGLNSGNTEAAKTDDARTEQRSGMQIVKLAGQRKDEVPARYGIFGVSPIDGVTGEGRRIARFSLRRGSNRRFRRHRPSRNAHTGAQRQFRGSPRRCLLRFDGRESADPQSREVAFDNMQVRPADSASPHAQPNLIRLEWRLRRLFDGQNALRAHRRYAAESPPS